MDSNENRVRLAPDAAQDGDLAASGSSSGHSLNRTIPPAHGEAPGDGLALYNSAKRALAEAHRVDEVKEIRDKAVAMAAYAKQAKDTQLLEHATEIRLRAERRVGEILRDSPKNEGTRSQFSDSSGDYGLTSPGKTKNQPPTIRDMGITGTQSVKWQRLAALPKDKFEVRVQHAKARVASMTTSAPPYSKAIFTGENEWYTPPKYVEAAREVLGEIDLDPASHAIAQAWIGARAFFTAADDGLSREWRGRVWLNPPYARSTMEPFIEKALAEIEARRVDQAIVLTHNYTDTSWFHKAARGAQALCLLQGRVHFLAPSGDECSPTQGQVFFYFGGAVSKFESVFGELGLVLRSRRAP